MTFRCDSCNKVSEPGDSAHRVVTEYRNHQHPYRPSANRDGSDDLGGNGQQVVKEKLICSDCLELA